MAGPAEQKQRSLNLVLSSCTCRTILVTTADRLRDRSLNAVGYIAYCGARLLCTTRCVIKHHLYLILGSIGNVWSYRRTNVMTVIVQMEIESRRSTENALKRLVQR